MPRQPRVVAVGAPHHITQRGNNRQEVFLSDEDRLIYIDLIREQSRICGSALLGYCLMTNHVHLVAVPDRADSFSRALQRAHSRYTQWFNRRYQRSGHLWHNRFFSCCLDRDHLTAALVYVDLNPVRAGMVGDAQDYRWSSARAHVEGVDPLDLIDAADWRQVRTRAEWGECLMTPPAESTVTRLRMATRSGSPCAGLKFVRSLEKETGRRLELRTRGRPRQRAAVASA
jgi:putative transposase